MTITRSDWQRIFDTMHMYRRREGFVDDIDGTLTFFDSDPCRNGIHACHVTIDEVIEYMNDDIDGNIQNQGQGVFHRP